jgi:hypothetical protein
MGLIERQAAFQRIAGCRVFKLANCFDVPSTIAGQPKRETTLHGIV